MEPNPILSAPDDALVCWCGKVDKKTILKAIADGNDTVEKLKKVANICPENRDCKHNNPLGRCCQAEVNALLRAFGKTPEQSSRTCGCCGH